MNVYLIDKIQTIIFSIKNNVALGFILNKDLTLDKCVVVKNDYYFAHGKNLKDALTALEEKTANNMPISERIKMFKSKFKNFSVKHKASLFYEWHYKLTGSCKTGRESFCKNNKIDLKTAKITVNEFIELTKNSYGGEIILKLKQ